MFRTANYVDNNCLRCGKTVYPTDKIGPLKDFTFFHSGCFRCVECSSKLTLKTYYNNQHSQTDKEVYCSTHVPKIGPGKFDGESIGIKVALNAPKSTNFVNEQIRPGGKASIDADAIGIRNHLHAHKESTGSNGSGVQTITQQLNEHRWGHFDTSALHIQHALRATEVQKKYSKPHEKPLEEILDREEQVELEARQKEEEDRLYKEFIEQRNRKQEEVASSVQEEWEVELEKLTAKFEREMGKKRGNSEDVKLLTIKHNKEKDEVKKNLTIKREKKKESIQRKLLEQERAATAALVEKHSQEMMLLIQEKRAQFETSDPGINGDHRTSEYPAQPPPPLPPSFAKIEIYKNPDEFAEVDTRAISVAQEDQKTFTDLVRQLVAGCANDVEKARAIFRWITVKNLNSLMFEDVEGGDTPLGLLRGIKFGTESYHVLFKRLCR